MPKGQKSNLCRWNCGQPTKNRSGICDPCWIGAELLRSNTDAGAKAWQRNKILCQAALKPNEQKSFTMRAAWAKRKELKAVAKG